MAMFRVLTVVGIYKEYYLEGGMGKSVFIWDMVEEIGRYCDCFGDIYGGLVFSDDDIRIRSIVVKLDNISMV